MTVKRKNPPEIGDRRVISKFLLFPKTIEDETRFFCFSSFIQEYQEKIEIDLSNEKIEIVFKEWTDVSWPGEKETA
jgi:hypothetical protein